MIFIKLVLDKQIWIMCRISGTWHHSSTVNTTVQLWCQPRKEKQSCQPLLNIVSATVEHCASHCWTLCQPLFNIVLATVEHCVSHCWTLSATFEHCVSHFWTLCQPLLNIVSATFENCISHFWTLCQPLLNIVSATVEHCVSHCWTLCQPLLNTVSVAVELLTIEPFCMLLLNSRGSKNSWINWL